jgi:hypothetical protein
VGAQGGVGDGDREAVVVDERGAGQRSPIDDPASIDNQMLAWLAMVSEDPGRVNDALPRYGGPMHFEEGWSAAPLRWVMKRLGAEQLARAAAEPGLMAAVDQHAAELRETIVLDRETLGDYLLGFLDELRERGWVFTGVQDFPALRLTAICRLARELGCLGDELPA